MSNPKSPAWYGGGLASMLSVGANLGMVFYVDGAAGDDGNSGLGPEVPLETITAALALCTNDRNDTIVVLDYWSPVEAAWPIDVSVSGVSIIGAKGGSYSSWAAMTPNGATSIFDISAQNVRLVDLYLVGEATQAGITFTGVNQRIGIYGCYFATGTYGIQMVVNAPGSNCEVADCFFAQSLSAGGILVANQAYLRIKDCVFEQPQGVCIDVGAAGGVQILNNSLGCDTAAAGEAITLAAGATHAHIDGNVAGFGEHPVAPDNNPYLDNAGADANTWLTNWWGAVATAPG